MASPLVATKLFVPRPRSGVVDRRRLNERLERGAGAKLTLISAPAGFGKTTLLAAWLAQHSGNQRVAWLSLDHTDNDAASFWSHLIIALQSVVNDVGATALHMLQSGQPADEAMLAVLLNELSAVPGVVHLVLDDYHAIDLPGIQAGMAFVVDRLPPSVRLVISTRADPALPLPRLRARGELVEVRSADLRFTAGETATYLSGAAGLGLSTNEIAALGDRTEGWIAALQLAALSMQGRDNVSAFIAGFEGNDRYIVDYLVEEVLQLQSAETRSFLLHTCFLSRLSGPLCQAVTGSSGAGEMLLALDRNNLFVVQLDDRREWYRYHHLFADVLLTHFADELVALLPGLHRRASAWYWQHGHRIEAVEHALASADHGYAAELMELAIPETSRHRGEAVIRSWLRQLPAELVRSRPVLGIGLIGALVSGGLFEEVEERLRDVERGLAVLAAGRHSADAPGHGVVVVDHSQLARLPGAVELYRAALAQLRGDVAGMIDHARRVLELAPPDDHLGRASGSAFLGISYWSAGELEAARRWWTEGKAGLERVGHFSDALGASIAVADITLAQGHLGAAIAIYKQALELAAAQDGPVLRGTADVHAGLSELYRERNQVQLARDHLTKSQDLGERAGLPQHPYRWRVAAARLRQDEGDVSGAADLLDTADRLYVSDFFPNVRPVAAIRARLWIAQGRLAESLSWQRDSGVSIDDDLSYVREFEHITLARLLVARGKVDDATGLLDRLGDAAERGGRMRSVIEISVLQALLHRGTGDSEAAMRALERALSLAEPEGFVRLIVDAGEAMAALLAAALRRGVTPAYTRTLLAAYGGPVARQAPMHPDLIEPLSERELDVLRLLGSELGGPEIARELVISVNTMRTHTKNIYEKLGVTNRRSAVYRAEALNLLAHRPRH